jgi:hypothetical protein
MLTSNLQEKLLVAWTDKIADSSARAALWHVVGFAACSAYWKCHPQWKGYLPDFRFHKVASNEQFFSFVPAKKWLLFYFRKPAIASGSYSWKKLSDSFPDAEQKSGEWRVRVRSLTDAHLLTRIIQDGESDNQMNRCNSSNNQESDIAPKPSEQDSRKSLAAHFHDFTGISRQEIFGDADTKLRPINLPTDNATMFAGYVGNSYLPGQGLLLLAINPGGGGDAYTQRNSEDEVFYPLLHAFKAANDDSVLGAFETVNEAFDPIVRGWNLWRILGPTLGAAGVNIHEVAYMNVVPYRTRGDKMPPVAARRASWEKIIEPTLNLLAPKAIITLGKKAGSVVDALMQGDVPVYCVPRTIGDSYISEQAKVVHETLRSELSGE